MTESHVDLSFFKLLAVVQETAEATALSESLKALGAPFKVVSSYAEAIDILNGERFDLALIEAGSELENAVQTIRSADASFRNMPVLVYASSSQQSGVAETSGANGIILKPANSDGFRQTIQAWADQIFSALPVLEEASIDKIRMFDDEEQTLLLSLFQIYSESTAAELQEIEQLVQQRDFPLLRKKAHKLKSSAAQLGAFRFEKYCTLMEYEPELDQARAQKLFQEMSTEYQNSLAKFDQYCQKHANA
jgi:HPt (histidine-containing phosphotransfer) domain-containing protein/CheY-like chemotaxis protein